MTLDEQLTDEERAHIRNALSPHESDPTPFGASVAKLLRLHDRLRAQVALLLSNQDDNENEQGRMAERIRELEQRPPFVHLDRIPSLEERKMLMGAAPGTCPTCGQRYSPPVRKVSGCAVTEPESPSVCPGCGHIFCMQWGDECWRNNGCPSTPPEVNSVAHVPARSNPDAADD